MHSAPQILSSLAVGSGVAVARLDGVAFATAFKYFFRLPVLAIMCILAPSGTGASERDVEDDPPLEDDEESESEESVDELLFEESVAPASFVGFQSESSVPTQACRRLPNKSPPASVDDFAVSVAKKMHSDAQGVHLCAIT